MRIDVGEVVQAVSAPRVLLAPLAATLLQARQASEPGRQDQGGPDCGWQRGGLPQRLAAGQGGGKLHSHLYLYSVAEGAGELSGAVVAGFLDLACAFIWRVHVRAADVHGAL